MHFYNHLTIEINVVSELLHVTCCVSFNSIVQKGITAEFVALTEIPVILILHRLYFSISKMIIYTQNNLIFAKILTFFKLLPLSCHYIDLYRKRNMKYIHSFTSSGKTESKGMGNKVHSEIEIKDMRSNDKTSVLLVF